MPRTLTAEALGEFREKLIDAAERLFGAHGLEAVTMRQLAAEVGVSPMTPYRYFADKEAILAAVRARAFNRHADALEAAYEATADDLERASEAVGRAYVEFAFSHPEAYKLIFDVTQTNERDYPDLVAAGERSRRTMTRHLEALAAAGKFDGDAEFVGHMLWAALHGPIMLAFSGKLSQRYSAQRIIDGLMEVLGRGFESARRSASPRRMPTDP
ncbi:MAG: TetR/AcrR family transcriptional regulator [Caulobacteraceae bacterium]